MGCGTRLTIDDTIKRWSLIVHSLAVLPDCQKSWWWWDWEPEFALKKFLLKLIDSSCRHCGYHLHFITKVWAASAHHESALCGQEHWPRLSNLNLRNSAYLIDTLVTGMAADSAWAQMNVKKAWSQMLMKLLLRVAINQASVLYYSS